MDPFAERTHTQEFPATGEHEAKSKKIWITFLTPRLLYTCLGTSKEDVKILYYQSNLVSCQFGISQTKPISFFNRKSDLYLCTTDYSEYAYLRWLTRHASDHPKLTLFDFQPSFYYTPEFETWWKAYHAKEFMNAATLSQHITDAYSSLQQKLNKGRARHIKEIQAFLNILNMCMILMTLVRRFVKSLLL